MGTAGNYPPDVSALFCGQCGEQIPTDSIFCPMCGFKAALPGAVTVFQMRRTALIVPDPEGEAEAPQQALQPAAPAVRPLKPQPARGPQPPQLDPLPPRRQVAVDPAPSARIPATPRPVRIVLGSLLFVLAGTLGFWFLPSNRPLTA
ncbi:MAG TPA: zinc-ribbon domain-containing protein, partial [Kofleriaceae bacterium]|nr:zinc-ribbon domain-containing protein [Kofleriaceae bacterium]